MSSFIKKEKEKLKIKVKIVSSLCCSRQKLENASLKYSQIRRRIIRSQNACLTKQKPKQRNQNQTNQTWSWFPCRVNLPCGSYQSRLVWGGEGWVLQVLPTALCQFYCGAAEGYVQLKCFGGCFREVAGGVSSFPGCKGFWRGYRYSLYR